MYRKIILLLVILKLCFATSYPYWIEHDENGAPLKNIWVKVNLSSSQPTKFYVYYEGTIDRSNGSDVFLVFQEFNNTEFDSNIWDVYKTPEKVGGGLGYSQYKFYDTVDPKTELFYTKRTFNYGVEVRSRVKYISGSYYEIDTGLLLPGDSSNNFKTWRYMVRHSKWDNTFRNTVCNSGSCNDGAISGVYLQGIYVLQYDINNNYERGAVYDFNTYSLLQEKTQTFYAPPQNFSVFIGSFGAWTQETANIYYIFVRKFDSTAVITITYGDEETGSWVFENETYTKRRLITISSNKDLTDYQINLDYLYFNNTALFITNNPGQDKTINITEANPSQGYLTRNKTINFTYTINYTDKDNGTASVELYIDNVLVANDTIGTGLVTLEHIINVSYGQHNYTIKAYSQANTSILDQLTRTFEVYFNITPITPENNTILVGNTTIFEIQTNNLYPIYCEYYLDAILIANETYITEGTYNITKDIANGTHSWQAKCYAQDNVDYSKEIELITFHQNYISYENQIKIPIFANVLDKPQRLFFDNKHNLWLLFFADYSPTDYVYLVRIENNQPKDIFSAPLNASDLADYFVLLPNNNSWDLLTFTKDANKYILIRMYINESNGTMNYSGLDIIENNTNSINGWSSGINYIFPNDYYDPWSYINLPENYTITQDSYYIFDVKVNTTSTNEREIYLVKEPNNDTLRLVKWGRYYTDASWKTAPQQTAPLDAELKYWIVPYINKGTSYNRPLIEIYQVSNKGASWTKKYTTCEYSNGNEIITTFGRSNYLFLIINNASCYNSGQNDFYIYEATTDKLYSENKDNLYENSFLIFTKNDTFNIFEETRTISVYFNGTFDVSEISYNDYGLNVPYKRGVLTTKDKMNNVDRIIKGKAILQEDGIYLLYTDQYYDAKFVTYDEQEEFRKKFKVRIYTNASSYATTNEVWGYTIPSKLIGGLKTVYITGHNGTKRLYIVGLNSNYLLEAWSLDINQGFYCTFTIYNQFQIPIPEARISALRYSDLKKSWVVVEQSITNLEGKGFLFLEPFNPYKIRVESDNYVTMEFDYTPVGTPCQVDVKLNSNGSVTQPMPNYHNLFQDVSYSIQPSDSFFKQPFNITFTISSASGKLEWAKMVVVKEYNNTKTTVYNTTLTNPNGGVLQYEANETGKYFVYTSFKHQDYEEYTLYPKTYWLGLNTGLTKAIGQLNDNVISGWAWFFLSLVIAILVAGFVSQYTTEGAGLMGILSMWIMSLIYPSGTVVCLATGLCMTTITATALLTLLVAGGLLATKYL